MKYKHLKYFNIILLVVLLRSYSVTAQLDGKSYGYIYNSNGASIELLLYSPKNPCTETGGNWKFRLRTKNLSQIDPKLKFINWKMQIENCSKYLIERTFSIDMESIVNFRFDGLKGNTDWQFEAKEIKSIILKGGLYLNANNDKDVNISFIPKIAPPDSIFGSRQAPKGQMIRLNIRRTRIEDDVKTVWYAAACAQGKPIFIGDEYSFMIEKNTILYVRFEKGSQFSECKRVEINIEDIRSIPLDRIVSSDGNYKIFLGEQQTLSLVGGKLEDQAKWVWYEASEKGDFQIGTGERVIVSPIETTTYRVRGEGKSGNTIYSSVVIEVNKPDIFWAGKNPFSTFKGCVEDKIQMNNNKVEKIIETIFSKFGVERKVKLLLCNRTSNCTAVVDEKNKQFLLFNSKFLGTLSNLDLSNTTSFSNKDWENIFIISHEIGHIIGNQYINRNLRYSTHQVKLTADSIAGKIMYKLGASIQEAETYLRSNIVADKATARLPSRVQRLSALNSGYNSPSVKEPLSSSAPINGKLATKNLELPCPKSTENAYLGLSTFSIASGALFIIGISKRKSAADWYSNAYSINPLNFSEIDFEKNKREYDVNSKLFMGIGASTLAGGLLVFFTSMKKIKEYNANCFENSFGVNSNRVRVEFTSKYGISTPGFNLVLPLNNR